MKGRFVVRHARSGQWLKSCYIEWKGTYVQPWAMTFPSKEAAQYAIGCLDEDWQQHAVVEPKPEVQ